MNKVLLASYGDPHQRERNQKQPDKDAARSLYLQYKSRENRNVELPTPPRGGDKATAFWNPKIHGDRYDQGGRNATVEGASLYPGSPPRKIKVEIRPGIFHTIETSSPGPGPPGGRSSVLQGNLQGQYGGAAVQNKANGRPSSAPMARKPPVPTAPSPSRPYAANRQAPAAAPSGQYPVASIQPPRSPGPPQTRPLPYQVDTAELAPQLAQVEEEIRRQIKLRAKIHVTERVVLLRAFGKVLGKKDVEIQPVDKITPEQLSLVTSSLGVALSPQLSYAIFNKIGQDVRGRMPVLNFVDALLYGAPRQIMLENDHVQQGAYKAGKPATHVGKIKYPQCKKGVWPPSDWDPRLAARSAELPDARLKLEFVYGYDGVQGTAPNLFYTSSQEVVYVAAAIGVVYNPSSHTQRFFLGHDDDILSLAIHPNRQLVATGQVGKDPMVKVWDSQSVTEGGSCRQVVSLSQGEGNRGVTALCFSPDGSMLACVCTDDTHTMIIWDWRKKQKLMERKSYAGTPPATYGVVWSGYEPDRLVTYGQNHIKFWTLMVDPKTSEMNCKAESGVFNAVKTHTVFSACFLKSGIVLSGSPTGGIVSWSKAGRYIRETPGHATGPMISRLDGARGYSGVRTLVLQSDNVLISGGGDGYAIKWDVSKGDLGVALMRLPLLNPEQMGRTIPPAIVSLDCYPGSDVFIGGTRDCDVWEVDIHPQVLVQGQKGSLEGLAMNPAYPHIFATVSEADSLVVFSAITRKPMFVIAVGGGQGDEARSAAFSQDGQQLAVGLSNGGVRIMEFHPHVKQVTWIKESMESIDVIKYSPCGQFMAVGSHDQFIYVYETRGYKRVSKCVGHSSTIKSIDWSVDSSVMMTNDQAYEQLFFEPRSGRQVKENMRDTAWATWSCTLGFDVMGIWPHDSDGTDINACDRSPSGRYLLTADDFGKVKLFNYPVVVQHAPSLVYPGHSSHVPNVRWSYDETFACSVGGRDRVTLQFRLDRSTPQPPSSSYSYVPLDKEGKIWVDPRSMMQGQGDYSSPQPQDYYDPRANKGGPSAAAQRTPQRGGGGGGGAMASPNQRPASARR